MRKALLGFLAGICFIGIVFVLVGCNRQLIDTTYAYDYAWIELPGGEVVEGKIQSWKDYEDGDQIQVTIDGKTYLTSTERAVLMKGE